MSAIYKILLTVLVAGAALFAGYRLFRYFNEKIQDSARGRDILAYSVLFFLVCAGLFFGAFAAIALVYQFLRD
jgi:nitrate reductase gamma subunit